MDGRLSIYKKNEKVLEIKGLLCYTCVMIVGVCPCMTGNRFAVQIDYKCQGGKLRNESTGRKVRA